MTRSKWKGHLYFYKYLNCYFLNNPLLVLKDFKMLYFSKREFVFLPQLVGKNIFIYNGKDWYKVFVISDILLYQFGKFVWTKKRCVFKKNKKKKKGKK
jgi:ribosomal protein S19